MSTVTVERRGATALLVFADPPEGTLDAAGSAALLEAVQAAGADPEIRALVIAGGQPGVFIRHYSVRDLAVIADWLEAGSPPGQAPAPSLFVELVDTIAALPKPVIAAINGLCMGGGFELSLACDLRIAGEDVAAIGLPEIRVGIFPGGGGTQRLPRLVGEAKALEIILRGATFHAREAHALGLVHELSDDPVARALDIAAELAARNPDAVAAIKALTRAALDRPVSEGLAAERRTFGQVLRSPEAVSALRAFVQAGAPLERT